MTAVESRYFLRINGHPHAAQSPVLRPSLCLGQANESMCLRRAEIWRGKRDNDSSTVAVGIAVRGGYGCCNQPGMRHPGVEPLAMRPQGQREGNYDSDRFHTRTLRYSLRRVSPLDSVNCGTHNPKVGGSNPPPATTQVDRMQSKARNQVGIETTRRRIT